MNGRAFVPSRDERFYLLKAHRQPLPENVAAHWIEAYTKPNDLIVDPFVASDAVVRAALAHGRRIIAADSNPLVAWVARIEATLPNARDLNGALLRLGDARKEGETLRTALERLYTTQCAQCTTLVTADYFVWRRDSGKALLTEKVYTCTRCGTRRDDANEADRQRANDAAPKGLSYHVLVQRLLADDAANTRTLKRLLERYTPRNLNALAAVTQKLDAEFRDDAARNTLTALFLHALDVGSSLYPAIDAPPTRDVPSEFVERNVWRALDAAARGLSQRAAPLRLAAAPAQVLKSTTPAAYIGQGGARVLAEAGNANAALLLSSPARLDPTFWEMSFLWARWLLGKTAAAPLEVLLNKENQRWGWYGKALVNALADTAKLARNEAHLVVAFPAGSHAMIEALMLAASPVFALQDFSFRPERGSIHSTEWGALRGEYQVVWKRQDNPTTLASNQIVATRIRAGSLQAAREILGARSEPLAYSWIHHAALGKLARDGVLAEALGLRYREGDNAFQSLRHRMEEGFKEGYIEEMDHWEEKERVLWMRREGTQEGGGERGGRKETRNEKRDSESESWVGGGWDWGAEVKRETSSVNKEISSVNREPSNVKGKAGSEFALQVEQVVRGILEGRGRVSDVDLDEAVLEAFGGLLTPEVELVEICARAYADRGDGEWVRREADSTELARAHSLSVQLGERLGYQMIEPPNGFDLIWRIEKIIPGSASGAVRQERIYEDSYAFLFREQVDLQELLSVRAAPLRGLVVLPESRVELTRERLRRDPRWYKRLGRAGWEFLRVPMIELLLREDYATRPEFQLAWGLEPPLAQGQEQLPLL